MNKLSLVISFCVFLVTGNVNAQTNHLKPRTIVTTDGEVDDQDSFIRFLLYANEFNIEGLVYSSSQWHYKGDGKGTLFTSEMPYTQKRYGQRSELRWPGTEWMQQLIGKYAMVYDKLSKNANGYPTSQYLLGKVKVGNIDFEGEMERNTEGSDYIKQILLDKNPGPVYLQIWGGTNTVARALKSIEEQYKNTAQWKDVYEKVSKKTIIYAVLDQDATYQKYVAPNWPKIKVLYNANQFWCFAYPWSQVVPAELQPYLQGKWFRENIKFNHGPLMDNYYLWGDGQKITNDPEHTQGYMQDAVKNGHGQYDFLSEGDSPSYLFLLDVGLRNMEDASYGSWGGRMSRSASNPFRWEDGKEVMDYNPFTKKMDAAFPQTRWIKELQNDFAARAGWCVKSYKEANHAPLVKLAGANTIVKRKGDKVPLAGNATDPDGNSLQYHWWQYKEAGTYKGAVDISEAEKQYSSFIVPSDVKNGETIHIILEVTDNGTPALTRYQRLIVTIKE